MVEEARPKVIFRRKERPAHIDPNESASKIFSADNVTWLTSEIAASPSVVDGVVVMTVVDTVVVLVVGSDVECSRKHVSWRGLVQKKLFTFEWLVKWQCAPNRRKGRRFGWELLNKLEKERVTCKSCVTIERCTQHFLIDNASHEILSQRFYSLRHGRMFMKHTIGRW